MYGYIRIMFFFLYLLYKLQLKTLIIFYLIQLICTHFKNLVENILQVIYLKFVEVLLFMNINYFTFLNNK